MLCTVPERYAQKFTIDWNSKSHYRNLDTEVDIPHIVYGLTNIDTNKIASKERQELANCRCRYIIQYSTLAGLPV
jgi:hypothetical protein